MRVLLLVGFCFLFLNCEDKQSKSKTKSNTSKTEIKVVEKDTTPQREFPYLDKDNVMDFFLDYEPKNPENKVRISTSMGDIDILLYDKTKFHRANFIFLTKQHAFDNTQFHRVVKNFIIQGGNTDDLQVAARRGKIGRYLLPTDTNRGYTHKRGVISMPSSDIENPYKLASPYEFFITQQNAFHLDGDFTVFGEVIKGMDVVDKINAVDIDKADWPLRNIYIKKLEIIE